MNTKLQPEIIEQLLLGSVKQLQKEYNNKWLMHTTLI